MGDRSWTSENIAVHLGYCDVDPGEPESKRDTANLAGVPIDGDRSRYDVGSGEAGSRMDIERTTVPG